MFSKNLSNSNSGMFSVFPAFEKKLAGKVSGKYTVTFWHNIGYTKVLYISDGFISTF